jgi:ABC-type nitrate/sulfonate/bicarbonate transport system substrate-binding protein
VFAQTPRNVTFNVSWVPEGSNLHAYVARNKGFWKQRGLDVQIVTGKGAVATAQSIATGEFPFGFVGASTIMVQVARGLQLVALGQADYKTTMGIGILADSPIRTPKDLEGRRLGATTTSSEFPYLPAYAQKAGIDMSKVQIIQLDARVRESALLQKQVDAITGVGSSVLSQLVPRGEKVRFMLYADAGLDQLRGQAIVTTPKQLKQDPALCQAVVEGLVEGVRYTALNFDESIEIFLKEVPEMALNPVAREQVRLSLGITQTMNLVSDVKERGIGWMDPEKYLSMWDLAQKYIIQGNAPSPPVDQLLTNQFVGKLRYTDSEWMRQEQSLGPYQAYFKV